MGLALVGAVIFVWDKAQVGLQTAGFGDLLSLAAALGFAIYTVANKRLLARHSAIVVITYTLTIGAVPALLVALPRLPAQDWSRITLLGWSALVWTIAVGVYLAWTLWNWVLARMPATRAALFLYLVPVVSGLLSWYLLDEHFGRLKVLGALVILTGVALARRVQVQHGQDMMPPEEPVISAVQREPGS
jgi:drug/metabolite transporter (DMT)-like permease